MGLATTSGKRVEFAVFSPHVGELELFPQVAAVFWVRVFRVHPKRRPEAHSSRLAPFGMTSFKVVEGIALVVEADPLSE
jgi:hypothetical protein